MGKRKVRGLSFEIDKLTRSIENVVTGDSFQTVALPLTKEDLKTIAKKRGWLFDWKLEFKSAERKVFKLTTVENPNVVQGLVSMEVKPDHVSCGNVKGERWHLHASLASLKQGVNFVTWRHGTQDADHHVEVSRE